MLGFTKRKKEKLIRSFREVIDGPPDKLIYSKNRNSVFKFINSLKFFGIGQSWGGFESLVLYQSHIIQRVYKKYIKPNHHLVRFHIGLEDPKDLIMDLKKGIRYIK